MVGQESEKPARGNRRVSSHPRVAAQYDSTINVSTEENRAQRDENNATENRKLRTTELKAKTKENEEGKTRCTSSLGLRTE